MQSTTEEVFMEIVVLNKIESIERCINRLNEIKSRKDFTLENYDYQDIVILNIQRACQQAIDLAMYITSIKSLGLPKSSRESFTILSNKSILTPEVEKKMIKMVGFRNIIIHEYQKVELGVIDYILENGLSDFTKFTGEILKYTKENR